MKTPNVKITVDSRGASYEWESFDQWMRDFAVLEQQEPLSVRHAFHEGNSGDSLWQPESYGWYGTPDGARGVLRRVDQGWPELREELLRMMSDCELEMPQLPNRNLTRRRKRVRQDHGDTLDITRVWNGDIDHAWELPKRTEHLTPTAKRVTLAFDVTDNGAVRNEDALWRAAVSLWLTDALARSGRVFEVWVIDSTSSPFQYTGAGRPPGILWTAWVAKASSEPIVMDRLCGMLTAGFMRSAGFAAMSMGPYTASAGFGGAAHTGLPDTLHNRREAGEAVIRIAGCYSKEQALQRLQEAWKEVEEHADKSITNEQVA